MADVLGGSGLVVGHDSKPRGHRFEHHVAEGLGQAGEQEQVTAGVMLGEVITAPGAAEYRLRQ